MPNPAPRADGQVPQVLGLVSATHTLKKAWQQLRATDPVTPSHPAFIAALRGYDDNGITRAVKGEGKTLIGSRMYLKVEVAERNARLELDSQQVPADTDSWSGTGASSDMSSASGDILLSTTL